ncbi:MAG: glycosyltransferase family 39 protein [Burkholderiales bacterium]|nr:glycosyltransferase family 39 protein [Burkholderiales bacterium]
MCALTWLVCGALYLALPPSPDQFNHAYLGWRLLMGDVPYRDTIDMNWPGVWWLHAMATGIFGVRMWSWRAFDYLLFGITCIFLCDLVRRAAGGRAARICAVTSPVLYVTSGYWIAGQHDMSAAQFLVAALWAHVRGHETPAGRWQFLAGAMLAAAMLNKPTVGIMLPLLVLHALMLGASPRRVVAVAAATTAGLLATLAAAAAAAITHGTTARELFDATIVFNAAAQYAGLPDALPRRPRSIGIDFLMFHGWRWADLALAAVAATIWLARSANRSAAGTAFGVLWLTGVLSYFVQGRGFSYHLAPALLALFGLLPIALDLLSARGAGSGELGSQDRRNHPPRPLRRKIALGILSCALGVLLLNRLHASYGGLPRALWSRDESFHLERFRANDGISVAEAVGLAELARTAADPDCFLMVGSGSAINYLSERRQPTRFYYFPMIAQSIPPLPMAANWRALWSADLRSSDCLHVGVSGEIIERWSSGDEEIAAVLENLLRRYDLVTRAGDKGSFSLYRRRMRQAPSPAGPENQYRQDIPSGRNAPGQAADRE